MGVLLLLQRLWVRSPVVAFCMTKDGSVHHAAMEPLREGVGNRDSRAQRSNRDGLVMGAG
jgi:hypothetical protein